MNQPNRIVSSVTVAPELRVGWFERVADGGQPLDRSGLLNSPNGGDRPLQRLAARAPTSGIPSHPLLRRSCFELPGFLASEFNPWPG